jgi:hypothetical protein
LLALPPFKVGTAESSVLANNSKACGVSAKGPHHDFMLDGARYRPTLPRIPTEANLNRARAHLEDTNGVHKNSTKTGHDRLFELCPRALAVLARHLRLRGHLVAEGRITHDQLFFRENGDPIQNLVGVQHRWRLSLKRTRIRRRRPYCARHSSVSWNLMCGKNPLWVARQHGHSVRTMLEIYAAWAEGRRIRCRGNRASDGADAATEQLRRAARQHPPAVHALEPARY